jgi:hypothetical protein
VEEKIIFKIVKKKNLRGARLELKGNVLIEDVPAVVEALQIYLYDMAEFIENESLKRENPKQAMLNKMKAAIDNIDVKEMTTHEILMLNKKMGGAYEEIRLARGK